MVTKNKKVERKGKVKVGRLNRKKETGNDLTAAEAKKIKGGFTALEHKQIGAKPASDLSAKFQVQLTEANGIFQ